MIIYIYRAIILLLFFFSIAGVLAVFWWVTRPESLRLGWTFDDLFTDAVEVLVDGDESKYRRAKENQDG